jgi:hypothetical protein
MKSLKKLERAIQTSNESLFEEAVKELHKSETGVIEGVRALIDKYPDCFGGEGWGYWLCTFEPQPKWMLCELFIN